MLTDREVLSTINMLRSVGLTISIQHENIFEAIHRVPIV